MMEKIQRFGSAMLAPVLIFAFAGLAVGIAISRWYRDHLQERATPGQHCC